jgi:hypothetical protein
MIQFDFALIEFNCRLIHSSSHQKSQIEKFLIEVARSHVLIACCSFVGLTQSLAMSDADLVKVIHALFL